MSQSDTPPELSADTVVMEIPKVLRGIVPTVGSAWEWEPLKPWARETVVVTAVRWNGEEVWVESAPLMCSGKRCWNSLDRWVEATVFVAAEAEQIDG